MSFNLHARHLHSNCAAASMARPVRTTSSPFIAATWAMPVPIWPACVTLSFHSGLQADVCSMQAFKVTIVHHS